ncbi:DUF1919 domain-containing protein [Lachnospiraceae bacterium 56-18]
MHRKNIKDEKMRYEVAIWGIGVIYNRSVNVLRYLELLGQIKIVAITATEIPNVNMVDGYQIVEKRELRNINVDYLIIMNDKHYKEIVQEAIICGIKQECILPYRILNIPYIDFEAYIDLKRSNISIISDNCWGGIVYHSLGLECLSPFKNLFVEEDDYIRLLDNLTWYMEQPLTFECFGMDKHVPTRYPIMTLGDVRIHCNHETDPIAAIEKWDRRRKKINYDNLFVEMYSERADIIERFLALNNYKKKLCFVTFQSDHPNLFTLDTKQRELWEVVNESSQYYLIDLLNGRKKTRYR